MIHEDTLQRFACFVVYLFVHIEGACRIVHGVNGNVIPCTAVDAAKTNTHVAGVIVDGQLGDPVLVEGYVVAQVPVPVLADNGTTGDGELDTLVLQFTHVGEQLVAEVGTGSNPDSIEQVGGLAVINIEGTGDAIVQKAIVETGVVGGGLFPFQVLVVSQRADQRDHLVSEEVVGTRLAVAVTAHPGIVAASQVLLSCHTVSQSQFEVRHCIAVSHEGFVDDLPCKGSRGEETPLVVGTETRRAVVTQCEGEQVAIQQRVV